MGRGIRVIKIVTCDDNDDDEIFFFEVFGRRVRAMITQRPGAVRRWIHSIIHFNRYRYYRGDLVVGLGVQWRSDPRNAGNEPVATVQFCVGHRCLIFQIIHTGRAPRIMERFLSNPAVTFVNVRADYDKRRLLEHCNLRVARAVDLWKRSPVGRISLEKMASRFLGWKLDDGDELKPKAIQRSDWEAKRLDEAQIRYACLDVYSSFLLELKFREISDGSSFSSSSY